MEAIDDDDDDDDDAKWKRESASNKTNFIASCKVALKLVFYKKSFQEWKL